MTKMKELYEKVATDNALQEKLKEIIKAAEKDGKDATEAKLTAFAGEAGFETTVEEAAVFFRTLSEDQKGELSESELDMVAGGKGGVLLSVGSLGFMCAVGSVLSEVQDYGCKKFIQDYE